jgi:hypothetical protein
VPVARTLDEVHDQVHVAGVHEGRMNLFWIDVRGGLVVQIGRQLLS